MDSKITNFVTNIGRMQDALHAGDPVPLNATHLKRDFDEVLAAMKVAEVSLADLTEGSGSTFQKLAEVFWNFGVNINPSFFSLSQQTYELWLEKALDFQRKNNQRIHKGVMYHQLGWLADNFGRSPENAYKYYLLAFVEDAYSKSETEVVKCPAYLNLSSQFGVHTHKLIQLIQRVKDLPQNHNPAKIIHVVSNDIQLPSYYELVAVDNNLIRDLRNDWVSLADETVESKGQSFEDFTASFFTAIRDFSVRRLRANALSGSNSKEHDYDVIFINESKVFQEFGRYFLVECKYTESPIGYPEIGKFFHKLHSKRCKTGILFTKSDVVDENLNSTIRGIYDSDGIIIITFNQKDINAVIDEKENLATLLQCKYEQVRFRLKKLL